MNNHRRKQLRELRAAGRGELAKAFKKHWAREQAADRNPEELDVDERPPLLCDTCGDMMTVSEDWDGNEHTYCLACTDLGVQFE